jgi:phage baseplate assembly protein W
MVAELMSTRAQIPHFSFPFRFERRGAAVVEQDSLEEIEHCVMVLLATRRGSRVELPDYGIDDPTFLKHMDLDAIEAAISEWEERADVLLEDRPDAISELVRHLQVTVGIGTVGSDE